jgi:hypothetical protein
MWTSLCNDNDDATEEAESQELDLLWSSGGRGTLLVDQLGRPLLSREPDAASLVVKHPAQRT